MHLCPPDCPCLLQSLCTVWWKLWYPCMAVCLCPSYIISVPTPCLEHVHALVHEFMSTWLSMSAPPLCLVSWKLGCPYLSLCLCPSNPACGPTPCLKCVHASLHEFMSTWLPISGPPPMHSFIETGCPCIAVCLCPSHLICSLTLFRMCTCISTCNYVHLTAQVWPRSHA